MRFLMINLILVCLLLLGIGYLAFGDTQIGTDLESHTDPHVRSEERTPWKASSETFQKPLNLNPVL